MLNSHVSRKKFRSVRPYLRRISWRGCNRNLPQGSSRELYGYLHCWTAEDDGDSRGCRSFASRPRSNVWPTYSLVGFWEALAQWGHFPLSKFLHLLWPRVWVWAWVNWNKHIQSTKGAINLGCFAFSGNLWALLYFFLATCIEFSGSEFAFDFCCTKAAETALQSCLRWCHVFHAHQAFWMAGSVFRTEVQFATASVTVSHVAGIGAVAQGKESFPAPEQARKPRLLRIWYISRTHPR